MEDAINTVLEAMAERLEERVAARIQSEMSKAFANGYKVILSESN